LPDARRALARSIAADRSIKRSWALRVMLWKFVRMAFAPGVVLAGTGRMIACWVTGNDAKKCDCWRNAGPEHRNWGLDEYVNACKEAMEAACEISGSPDCNVLGICAGGITTSLTLGHLAAMGDKRVNAGTLLVTIWRATASTTASPRQSSPMPGADMRVPAFFTVTSVPSGNTVSRCATMRMISLVLAPARSPITFPAESVRTLRPLAAKSFARKAARARS